MRLKPIELRPASPQKTNEMIAKILLFIMASSSIFAVTGIDEMALLPTGTYQPFILKSDAKKGEQQVFRAVSTEVKTYYLDRRVVTNDDFLRFVKNHPEWRKSKTPSLFADGHYLGSWKSDLNFSKLNRNKPVTQVSWFAAKAYCESLGKALPTTNQWEYALHDQGRNQTLLKEKILEWYSKPNGHAVSSAGTNQANGFGLHDMVGLIWEWTLDFNAFMAGDELRGDPKDSSLFCGGGSLGKLSADDYAAFMRYSFRASLKANYTTENLGFRCAKEKK